MRFALTYWVRDQGVLCAYAGSIDADTWNEAEAKLHGLPVQVVGIVVESTMDEGVDADDPDWKDPS